MLYKLALDMKKLLFFLLVGLPMSVFGQKNANLEVGPGLNFTDYTNKIAKTDGRLKYDFGLAMTLPMKHSNREWMLGLRFMAYGDKYASELRWGTQHNGQGGFDPNLPSGELANSIKSKSSYFYFEMPVGIRQYLTSANTRIFVQATAGPSYFLSGQNQSVFGYNDGSSQTSVNTDNSLNIRTLNLVGGVGLGLEIPVSEKLSFQCVMHGQSQFLDIASNSETHAKWYAFGLRAGLRYRLF